jgi:hypothetical protein
MKLIYIFLSIIVIFLYVQYKFVNKVNNDLNVLQIENPTKDIFENVLLSKSLSVFTNVSKNFYDIQKYSLKDIKTMDDNSKKNFLNNIKNHFSYYDTPFLYKNNIDIFVESSGTSYNIKKQNTDRFLLCQLKGTIKLICFTPNQAKYLYLNKNKDSTIDFWKSDLLNYPLLSDTKYLEISLYPGQMVYIPHGWYYGYIVDEDSVSIISKSNSIFSKLLQY